MAPTRVGFIGLSKVGWARGAHLPYLKSSPDYEIVAVCNSTVQSAKDAITLYELGEGTKALADPEELAKDPDIDLVVCSVRVDRHLPTISPALKAGKNVYVEWPLGKNLADAEELLRLKNEGGVKKAVVGLQAREAPIIKKVKELLDEGSIGKVLSSTFSGYADFQGGTFVYEPYEYLTRREIGGNLLTIHFGHAIDYVQYVLGNTFTQPPKSLLSTCRKTISVNSLDNKIIIPSHTTNSPDTVFVHGTLTPSIPVSLTLRGGKVFPGQPGLDWRIYGSTGEIRITASGPSLQIGYPDMKIELLGEGKEDVEVVEFKEEGGLSGVSEIRAGNVARIYKGLTEGTVACSFEEAVERHRVLEGFYGDNDF